MRFDELNEDNYILFAIKNYDNPQAATKEDFFEDMRRFKYIKRLLKKYHKGTEVKLSLLLNHIKSYTMYLVMLHHIYSSIKWREITGQISRQSCCS